MKCSLSSAAPVQLLRAADINMLLTSYIAQLLMRAGSSA
jgi:hypothetical protein